MAVNVDKGLFVNPNRTREVTVKRIDENGEYVEVTEEVFGVEEIGYRDPDTHAIIFDDADNAEAQKPQVLEAPKPERVSITKPESSDS